MSSPTSRHAARAPTENSHRNLRKPKSAVDGYRYGRTVSNIIGYARVSTREQSKKAQEVQLAAYWAVKVFIDGCESSRIADRPQWLDCLRAGDTLLIRKLDRIAGSEVMAIQTTTELHDCGVQIKILTEPDIDETTPMGRALFGFVAVPAQLRVDTIRGNTHRGLAHKTAWEGVPPS